MIDEKRAAFEAWIKTHCDYDDLDRSEMLLAFDAWQAALKWASETEEGAEALGFLKGLESGTQAALASPEVQELYASLKEVVDAADGEGWDQLDPGMGKQRAALAAMEKSMSETPKKWIWMMDWCKSNGLPPSDNYFWSKAESAYYEAKEKQK